MTVAALAAFAALAIAACGDDALAPTQPQMSQASQAPGASRAVTSTAERGTAALAAVRPDLTCPNGWSRVQSGSGVALCTWAGQRGGRKVTETVVLVDLERGAQILSLFENTGVASTNQPSPRFAKYTVQQWWSRYGSLPTRFCMQNGAFFSSFFPGSTPLTFPLKQGGTLITAGENADASWKRALVLEPRQVSIQPYDLKLNSYQAVANALTARTVVVGRYRENNDTQTREYRTFVAIKDGDRNGTTEIVMLYASSHASTDDANTTLRVTFGASDAVQFDGGGSAQLTCRGTAYHTANSRDVPQVFAVFEAAR